MPKLKLSTSILLSMLILCILLTSCSETVSPPPNDSGISNNSNNSLEDSNETTGTNHSYIETITEPTKSTKGYTTYTCKICDHTYTDKYVPAIGSTGLEYSIDFDKKTCTITGIGTCKDTDIYIPSMIDIYTVTTIGEFAFFRNENISSIIIPDSVFFIERAAFYDCKNLTYLSLPDSIIYIQYSALYGCSSLTSLFIPNSITKIGDNMFSNCYNLKKIYYCGTKEIWYEINEWWAITAIDKYVYYYSEEQPVTYGNYWHYVNDVPTKW